MPIELDDPTTIDACRILANAVHQVRIPGVVEFGVIERSLTTVIQDHSPTAFSVADGAFRSLDKDCREAIAGTAIDMAHSTVSARKRAAAEPVAPSPAERAEEPAVTIAPRVPRRPSGLPALITAINHRSGQ